MWTFMKLFHKHMAYTSLQKVNFVFSEGKTDSFILGWLTYRHKLGYL